MASSSKAGQPALRVPFPETSSASPVAAWVHETRKRLEEGEEQRAFSSRARGQKRFLAAAEGQDDLQKAVAEGAAARATLLTAEEAESLGQRFALDFCRRNLGMKSVMFEPQASTVYILGRPVQVLFFFPHAFLVCARSLSPLPHLSKHVQGPTVVAGATSSMRIKKQVMVLTHEDAPLEETMPYFGCRLAPAKPNLFFGRAAKREPRTKTAHAVFDWFKDHLLTVFPLSFPAPNKKKLLLRIRISGNPPTLHARIPQCMTPVLSITNFLTCPRRVFAYQVLCVLVRI